ncbi:MAG TPA: TetR/AcrR family transcriptional regulator [Gemmatimonadales bacterium]|nr:TetR/AcrR family transcriptional regulator [Gemmatimonadales bacterium]
MPRRPRQTRRPRWQRRPEARPEEILAAALEVFGELGFARTRLDDVARRAGVSKGTLYLYFDSKDALFRAMVTARLEAILAHAEEFVRNWKGSTSDLLRAFTTDYWATMNQPEKLRLSRVVIAELGSFPELAKWYYQEVILRSRRVIQSILARGIEAGEFRPVNTAFTARALQLLVVNMAQFLHYFQKYDPAPLSSDEILEGIVDLYLHAVQVTPASVTRT